MTSSINPALPPRRRQNFDAHWRFLLGDPPRLPVISHDETYHAAKAGYAPGAASPDYDDRDWRELDLPHDWVVEGRFAPDANCSHGFLPVGVGWYRKTFDLPATSEGRCLSLEFDGVFRNSTVWLNGHCLGTHPSGYTSFAYDISAVAHYGGPNVLAVKVDASEFEGWWYEGGGIYRHVWLVETAPLHVARYGVFVTANLDPLSGGPAALTLRTTVVNEGEAATAFELQTVVLDPQGAEVARVCTPQQLAAGESAEYCQAAQVTGPQLWSPDQPHLYQVQTTLVAGGETVDGCATPLGLRTIAFDGEQGFWLNGRPLKLQGVCCHQDHAGVGVALPDRVNEFRIERLKEMGANAYRCAHHPPTPELLDACDRLGMLVMNENRKLDCSAEGLADLDRLVLRDRHHPSVIMWSLANEEPLQGSAVGTRIAARLIRRVRELDPTRPVTTAMNGNWGQAFSLLHDVQGCNYSIPDYDGYHEKSPSHPMVGSETASAVGTRGVYVTDPGRGYLSAYDVNHPAWGATAEEAWRAIAERDYLAGTFVWTGFDYRGEPTPYRWPCISSHFGIMDTCGFPKDSYYYYQSWWSDRPVLHLLPHWNWPGREGEMLEVWCYSNCEEVELWLNGQSLGRQTMPRHGHLQWVVAYAPGSLRAVGYTGGAEVLQEEVITTGPAAQILLQPDRGLLQADGRDVALVTVAVTDAQGRIVPTADNLVRFAVSGGRILGVGNGDPCSHEPDQASQRRVFGGLAQVIVQTLPQPGPVVLSAQSDGLPPVQVALTARTK